MKFKLSLYVKNGRVETVKTLQLKVGTFTIRGYLRMMKAIWFHLACDEDKKTIRMFVDAPITNRAFNPCGYGPPRTYISMLSLFYCILHF